MIRPRLIIFAKAPVLGRAKTRLAKDIGIVHAKRLYRSMTRRIIYNVQDPRWDTLLAVTPDNTVGAIPDWQGLPQIAQGPGNLSPRLARIFSLYRGPVIVIGTDCPQVNAQDIAKAIKALGSNQAVFGPANDGGFWLMGMNGPVRKGLFDGVRWSSEFTLSDLSANIDGQIARLHTLTDIDDLEALLNVRTKYPGLI